MKVLVVVDMQNDFITGSLGSPEAQKIVSKVRNKVLKYRATGGKVIFTKDSHNAEGYDYTLEGKKLPVCHCIERTDGWKIIPELKGLADMIIYKETFGSNILAPNIEDIVEGAEIESIEFCGVCTDICVVSNALITRAEFPNTIIKVDSCCCAGTTPEAHNAALQVMKSCQIDIY